MTDTAPATPLYPSMQPGPELLDDPPPNVAALRRGDATRLMYPEPHEHIKHAATLFADLDPSEQASTQRQTAIRNVAEIFRDLRLTDAEAGEMTRYLSGGGGVPDKRAANIEATAHLRRVYGDKASQALADARRLVARDPRFRAMVDKTGAGDNPKFIMLVAEVARRESVDRRL